MNNTPHLLAIVDSKVAQLRTQIAHSGFAKAEELLKEIKIYVTDLQTSLPH